MQSIEKPVVRFDGEAVEKDIKVFCKWSDYDNKYQLYFRSIKIKDGVSYESSFGDDALEITDDPEVAKKVFDFALNTLKTIKSTADFLRISGIVEDYYKTL